MTQLILILTICILTLTAWTRFQNDFAKGDKVVLTKENYCDTLFIGQTTIEEVIRKYGQVKVYTYISKFRGKTEKPLYDKRQILEYKDKGLTFIFESDGVKPKKIATRNICLLDEIIITSPSDYCIDNICVGTTKSDIIKKFGNGVYGITNGVTDSLNRVWYNPLGLWLTYKQTEDKIMLVEILREQTESYFNYRQKESYKKHGIPFSSDSLK